MKSDTFRIIRVLVFITLMLTIVAIDLIPQTTTEDYAVLLTDYESLLDDYEDLLNDYETSTDALEALNNTYKLEIDKHQLSKEQILLDKDEISLLRGHIATLSEYVDLKYFTVFANIGYFGEHPLGELIISADIPKLPFSILAGAEYIHTVGINIKLGAGVRF